MHFFGLTSLHEIMIASSSGTKKAVKVKETQEDLCDFYTALDVYAPTIPEAVTKYYMQKSGINAVDPRMVKLISLAADKFLSETIHEARQMSLLRKQGLKQTKRKTNDSGDVLEIEDLERCLKQQEIVLKRKKTLDNIWWCLADILQSGHELDALTQFISRSFASAVHDVISSS